VVTWVFGASYELQGTKYSQRGTPRPEERHVRSAKIGNGRHPSMRTRGSTCAGGVLSPADPRSHVSIKETGIEVNWETAMAACGLKFGLKLVAALSFSIISSAGNAYTPEQQHLCSNDAIRLCSSDIPDVDRITACMTRQRNLLSPACKAFFPTDEAKKTKKPAGAS
jgi:hypothetical protein